MNESISELRARISQLEDENWALKQRLKVLEPQEAPVAEFYIAELSGGSLTSGLVAHDVVGSDGSLFEVKYSRLNTPVKGAKSKRWSWGHPLGNSGLKAFDYLILVGEIDPRYAHQYEGSCPFYVLFCVPYDQVTAVMRDNEPLIQITTNPLSIRSASAKRLFEEFYITPDQFSAKFNKSLQMAKAV